MPLGHQSHVHIDTPSPLSYRSLFLPSARFIFRPAMHWKLPKGGPEDNNSGRSATRGNSKKKICCSVVNCDAAHKPYHNLIWLDCFTSVCRRQCFFHTTIQNGCLTLDAFSLMRLKDVFLVQFTRQKNFWNVCTSVCVTTSEKRQEMWAS